MRGWTTRWRWRRTAEPVNTTAGGVHSLGSAPALANTGKPQSRVRAVHQQEINKPSRVRLSGWHQSIGAVHAALAARPTTGLGDLGHAGADSSLTTWRIGFSNALFPSLWHSEHGRTRRPTAFESVFEGSADLLSVDSAGEKRLCGRHLRVTLSPGRFHRSRNHSDAADSSGPGRRGA